MLGNMAKTQQKPTRVTRLQVRFTELEFARLQLIALRLRISKGEALRRGAELLLANEEQWRKLASGE